MLRHSPFRSAGAGLVLAVLSSACQPELVVGKVLAGDAGCSPPAADGGAVPAAEDKVVEPPWSTGFEDGFCTYVRSGGYCYGDPDATRTIVREPVHEGRSAAAFRITTDPVFDGSQTRCFLEGALPREAVYGTWFYIPALATNTGNWNLVHFQGGVPGGVLPGLWDVSLANAPDGSLYLFVRDFLNRTVYTPAPAPPVPIGEWFHVQLYLLRAADATGEVALFQNGVELVRVSGIITDNTEFGQWYVGNLADALSPPDSTVYVDDVTLRTP